MGIIYYPDEIQKKRSHPIDIKMREMTSLGVSSSQDLNSSALDYRLALSEPSWAVEMVTLHFNGSTARNYAISIEQGRGIISGLNDNIWIGVVGSPARRIILSEGFYTGPTLASEIKAQLDEEFSSLGITWVVSWSDLTHKFTITPSTGLISFFSVNTAEPVRRNSKAGHVLGFTVDASGNSLESDTACPSLGSKAVILSETASSDLDIVLTDELFLDVDSALHIDVSSVNLIVDYTIRYRLTDSV